ncbi:MAG TPA: M23 family metallopeptidase [Firmicutes bacterium]|nr:M23 family metallopeptidase [Bacillota bacterium]
MAIKLKLAREWLAGRLTRLSIRSAAKGLPWSKSLTRKGALRLSLLLLAAVTVSGIFYFAYSSRPMGRSLVPGKDFGGLDALTGALPEQWEGQGAGEPPVPLEGPVTKAEVEEPAPAESAPATAGPVAGEEGKAAGEVPVLAVQEFPSLPGNLINPVIAPVTAEFGWRQHPVFGDWRFHPGVDLAAPPDTPVQAVLAGVVADIYKDPILGQVMVLAHDSNWESRYGHIRDMRTEVGGYVAQGEVIALVEERNLYPEAHLHFELRWNGQAVDPQRYLPAPSPPEPEGSDDR